MSGNDVGDSNYASLTFFYPGYDPYYQAASSSPAQSSGGGGSSPPPSTPAPAPKPAPAPPSNSDSNEPPAIPLFTPVDYLKHFWWYNFLTDPHACAGGGFGYAGVEAKVAKVAHVELLALVQYDTKTGGSHGGLVGGGLGPATVGFESMRNWRDWSVTNSMIGLGGSHVGKVDVGGLIVPSSNGVTVGGYAGGGSFGGGGYVTISPGPCKP